MMTTICYKTKDGKEYLSHYTHLEPAEAELEVRLLNSERPSTLWNGEKIDWEKVDSFFVDEQEMFDTRDSF